MKRRFNWVDAVLVVLVVAMCALCLWFLRQRDTISVSAEREPMQYTVELNGMPLATADMLQVGQSIYDSKNSTYLGTLVDFSYEPYTKIEYSQVLEKNVTYTCKDQYRVKLVIENEGQDTGRDLIIGETAIKIGKEMYVKGKGFAGSGYVVGIDTLAAKTVADTSAIVGDEAIVYTVYFEDVRDVSVKAFHVGDRIYNTNTGAVLGEITNVDAQPFYTNGFDKEGNSIAVEKEGRYGVILTLASRCTQTESSYFVDGREELKIGGKLAVTSKYYEGELTYFEILKVGE